MRQWKRYEIFSRLFLEMNTTSKDTPFESTFPTSIARNFIGRPYIINVFRGALTRNLSAQFSEVREEAIAAFEDEIPLTKG